MKLVHAADLHLDSPLAGLERYEGAPVATIRGATRRALQNLVDLCIAEQASLLLLAGDLYDGDWRDYATGLFFAEQMSRLRREGVQVVLVWGNHDAESQISRELPVWENVTVLASHEPETRRFEALGVAVHGQSYESPAEKRDLAAGYPEALEGWLNVGLLHTAASGRPGHQPYAPCELSTLKSKGYAYWALGHVHRHEILCEDPWVVFPGNLQGRHIRETGPKGAMVIDVDGGQVRDVRFVALDALRWARLVVDVAGATSPFDVFGRCRAALEAELEAAEGRPLAVRLTLRGRTEAHDALMDDRDGFDNRLRSHATDVGPIWLERVDLDTEPTVDAKGLASRDDAVGQVARRLLDLEAELAEGSAPPELVAELAELGKKLPPELRKGEGALRFDDPETLRRLLVDVRGLLLSRMLRAGREEGR
ncbi:MAG: DNA repair exonuclease [Myxococcales bacterium]|nr:DNA repair exonuclease [Myxococcales bacterium]